MGDVGCRAPENGGQGAGFLIFTHGQASAFHGHMAVLAETQNGRGGIP
jgi:hypothetical protein